MSNQNHGTSERRGGSNDRDNPQSANEPGVKGGQQSHGGSSTHEKSGGQHGGSEHKSGQHSQNAPESQRSGSQKSGSHKSGADSSDESEGNFADDPEKAREAGRKGGRSSHRGTSE